VKLGAENSRKTMLAIGLFALALILVARMFFAYSGSSNTSAAPTAPAAVAAPPNPAKAPRRTSHAGKPAPKTQSAGPVTPSLDPRLRLKELKEAESTDYTGKGRNIFLAQATESVNIPQPVASALKRAQAPPPPPVYTPPPPPPIDLKFFGFASTQGVKRVFLARGDDVFVASEGEIVNRRYKIVKINNNDIEVLDMLSNNRQTIPLTTAS
jgi:hypothetical protein